MSYSFLLELVSYVVPMVNPGLCIVSAVILLKERHLVVWLMLAGGVLYLSGVIANSAVGLVQRMGKLSVDQLMQWFRVFGAVCHGGFLLFAVGLLLYALRQRAKANRITELEAIIASMQSSR